MPSFSFEDFKKALQRRPIPSAWSGELPPLEEMVPWADPVKRGVASPEMMAEQGQRDELMQNAEFRPANARERKLARLAKMVERSPYSSDRIAAMPREVSDKALKKIHKEYKPEEWTNQVEGLVSGGSKEDVWGPGPVLDKVLGNLHNERMKDFAEAGYANASPYRTGMMGTLTWQNMNKVASKPKPDFVYHSTSESNIPSIAEKGLLSAKEAERKSNFMRETGPQFPEQQDKVFFSETPNTIEKLLGKEKVTAKTLRKRYTDDLNPDMHQDEEGSAWYQTRKPVPPTALEIEAAPGVWEPLIEYMKKRGGK
jgi:hypothetical protein